MNVIKGNGFAPSETDVHQLLVACRSQRMNYAVDTNDLPNTLTVSFVPPIGNEFLTSGLPLRIKPLIDNTDACTLIVDSIEHPLRRSNGAELIAGDIINGIPFDCMWNDAGYWVMTNYRGVGGDNTVSNTNNYVTKIPYTVDTGTPGHIIAAFTPSITNPVPGDAIEVKLTNNIVGATGIVINSLPEVAVVRPNGGPMQSGDGATGQVALMFRSDAGNWQFSGIIPPTFSGFGVPVGSMVLTLGSSAPPGTLKLNGVMLSRAEHPGLWAFAQGSGRLVSEAVWANGANWAWTAFSSGDGVSTFRLPDFRYEFMRFNDDGRGGDTARPLWQWQPEGVGNFSISGNMDLLNPRLSCDSTPVHETYRTFDHNGAMSGGELAWASPRYEWTLTPGNGWPDLSPDQYQSVDPGYNTYTAVDSAGLQKPGGGADKSRFFEVNWVIPQFPTAYGYATGYPTGWVSRPWRISGNFQFNGTGGSNETRPRNTYVTACIVDG